MAETENGSKPAVVVDGVRKATERSHSRPRKKTVLIVIAVVVICGVAGWAIYHHYSKNKTIVIDGQTYKADYVTNKTVTSSPSPATEVNQQIQTQEAKVKQAPSYKDYLALGNLYTQVNNKQQAVAAYKKAELYVPKDQYYQSRIDDLNQSIQTWESSP